MYIKPLEVLQYYTGKPRRRYTKVVAYTKQRQANKNNRLHKATSTSEAGGQADTTKNIAAEGHNYSSYL